MQKLLDIIRHSWFQDTWSIFDSYWSSWKCAVLLWKPTNYTKQTKVGVIQNLFVTKLGEPNGVVFTESQMISFTFSRNAGLGKRTRLAKVASHKTLQEILVIYLRSQKFLVLKLPLLQGFFGENSMNFVFNQSSVQRDIGIGEMIPIFHAKWEIFAMTHVGTFGLQSNVNSVFQIGIAVGC